MARRQSLAAPADPLAAALASCRGALMATGLFSGVLNVLMLAGAIYMLQVYDRVLTSRSLQTLVGLTALLGLVFLVQGVLDIIRQRLLTRIGASIDRQLAPQAFRLIASIPVRAGTQLDAQQPARDLDSVRGFMSSLGPTAFFDLPWLPVFLILCFLMHVWIGTAVLLACVALFVVTLLTERATKAPMLGVTRAAAGRALIAETSRRNAEAIAAMGMQEALAARYGQVNGLFLSANEAATDVIGTYATVSRIFRMAMQSAILGLGAWLVLIEQATPGVMIASSILMGRALAPIEAVVSHWKSFVAARQGWHRLREALRLLPAPAERMALPPPKRMLTLEQVVVAAPGSTTPIIQGVSFSLLAGQALGVIGPSASGKSTLARVLSGAWRPLRGSVRLDGAELEQWSDAARGAFIGYLPQDIGLFDGTVAENIARFRPGAASDDIVAAARAAGADEMIRKLPSGYETRIGEGGMTLSGGQRQRVALARALFGNPFLVILDEPNANLDAEGEAAVTQAIRHVRERQGIAIVIAHRPSAIAAVDVVGVMKDGRMQAFGPRDEVLKRVLAPPRGQTPS
ncbi:type I secretion system permease/ATPase [Phreatobacter sp. HK31-P]